MPRTTPPRFRPTRLVLWPADPGGDEETVTHPLGPVRLVKGWLFGSKVEPGEWKGQRAPLPADFVLREVLDCDPTDDESVRAFVEQWGASTIGAPRRGSGWGFDARQEGERIRLLQVLVNHHLAHAAGLPVAEAWERVTTPSPFDPAMVSIAVGSAQIHAHPSEREFWQVWLTAMNDGLSKWSMNVLAESPHGSLLQGTAQNRLIPPTPYQLAVRQLAVMASEGEEIRFCANVHCRRPFTRQRGRARHRPRAQGIKYCSHECAKAQSERERRARRKAES